MFCAVQYGICLLKCFLLNLLPQELKPPVASNLYFIYCVSRPISQWLNVYLYLSVKAHQKKHNKINKTVA
jgi:hypothetical protein